MPTHLAGREFCKFLSISLQHLAPGAGARGSQGCPSMIRFDKYIKKFKSALLVGYINILLIMIMILTILIITILTLIIMITIFQTLPGGLNRTHLTEEEAKEKYYQYWERQQVFDHDDENIFYDEEEEGEE